MTKHQQFDVLRIWRAAVLILLAAAGLAAGSAAALAQRAGFEHPWRLDLGSSSLTFQSVKKGTIVETSKFATLDGTIGPDGQARVDVVLESVDTGVDLRNVRMRFLFFETYKYPVATISAAIDPAVLQELPQKRRMRMDISYKIDLHGVVKDMKSPVVVTLIDNDTVSVASAAPIIIAVADFGLAENITKLEQAVGNITITPSTSVSFDFVFDRTVGDSGDVVAAVAAPQSAALESSGNLTAEECATRFETLSKTQAVYFRTASAELRRESEPLLDTVVDIAKRCPGLSIEIAGHTDSDGSEVANQLLSEKRAGVVAYFLTEKGIPAERIKDVGYGESKPVAANDSRANKSRNRRIEFHVSGG
jgi:outer membrane protein OmpA-like peptidoglycan-associated protein/polyisoprenoid-binding protein YceI